MKNCKIKHLVLYILRGAKTEPLRVKHVKIDCLSVEQDVVGSKPISLPKAIHILLVKCQFEKATLYAKKHLVLPN